MHESKHRLQSRVAGRGAITRSLAGLIIRLSRYARARAATMDERQWAAALADRLEAAYRDALADPAASFALTAANARAERRRKAPAVTAPPLPVHRG